MTARVLALLGAFLLAGAAGCGAVSLPDDAARPGDGGGELDGHGDGGPPPRADGAPPPVDAPADGAPPAADGAPPRADGASPPADGASPAERPLDAAPAPPPPEVVAFGCPPDDALLACYTFDNATNRLLDGSRHGHHGMINSARVTPGVRGSALSFVAGNEFALVPPAPTLAVAGTGFTFEAWVRPTMSPVDSRVDFIAARWNTANVGFLFGAYAEELAINSSGGVGRRSTGKLPLARWSHVAVVVAATTVTMYLQGTAEAPAQAGLTFTASDEPMTIGNRDPAASPDISTLTAFRGDIDVLRIYARARRPAEVCADANRTWNGTTCTNVSPVPPP